MLTNTYTKARREAARISERAARGELAYDFTADGETVIDPESLYASTAVLFMDLTEETSRNALVDSAEDQFFAACDDAEAEFEAELEGTTHKSGLSSLDYTVLAIFEPAYDTSTLPGWHAWELEMIKRAHQLASRSQTSRRGAIGTIGTVVATASWSFRSFADRVSG